MNVIIILKGWTELLDERPKNEFCSRGYYAVNFDASSCYSLASYRPVARSLDDLGHFVWRHEL